MAIQQLELLLLLLYSLLTFGTFVYLCTRLCAGPFPDEDEDIVPNTSQGASGCNVSRFTLKCTSNKNNNCKVLFVCMSTNILLLQKSIQYSKSILTIRYEVDYSINSTYMQQIYINIKSSTSILSIKCRVQSVLDNQIDINTVHQYQVQQINTKYPIQNTAN